MSSFCTTVSQNSTAGNSILPYYPLYNPCTCYEVVCGNCGHSASAHVGGECNMIITGDCCCQSKCVCKCFRPQQNYYYPTYPTYPIIWC